MNKEFLKQLDQQQERDLYVKIISLDINDNPLEAIEGKAQSGSVNIDGKSSVRRTCSLNLTAAADTLINDFYWCFNTKFKLQIGLANLVNPSEPPIVWFDQGVFLITSFGKNISTNNITITIQGKDKMARLNGDIGGVLPVMTDFGQIENVDNRNPNNIIYTLEKIPIKTIIREAIRKYGQEREENVIINDLDDYGYELWEYIGEETMYYFISADSKEIVYLTTEDINIDYKIDDNTYGNCKLSEVPQYYSTNILDPNYNNTATPVDFTGHNNNYPYRVIKIASDETAGYHRIPLVYSSDLILNAGETIVTLLDKIVKMLGSYEYFYDVYGRFVFQKQKNYTYETYSSSNGALNTPILYNNIYAYEFNDNKLLTSISPAPDISNVKNDFSVWGTKKLATGQSINIHARCAIDKKPIEYTSPYDRQVKGFSKKAEEQLIKITNGKYYYILNNGIKNYQGETMCVVGSQKFTVEEESEQKHKEYIQYYINLDSIHNDTIVDDEENIIFRAQKIIRNNDNPTLFDEDNELLVIQRKDDNNIIVSGSELEYPVEETTKTFSLYNGLTTYLVPKLSEYNIDLRYELDKLTSDTVDWRELIYQMALDLLNHSQDLNYLLKLEELNPQFINGKTGYEQYYSDLEGFWRLLYSPFGEQFSDEEYYTYYDILPYWNKKIHNDPSALIFWFEFLDTEGQISQYSVKKIGSRPKVINENTINSIYYKGVPEVLFTIAYKDDNIIDNSLLVDEDFLIGKINMQVPEADEILFVRSVQGVSAIEKINELIQSHTECAQTISLSGMPIFYLQPNTRIYINNYGDYNINRISYNLNYNGTMTINATKIFEQFI